MNEEQQKKYDAAIEVYKNLLAEYHIALADFYYPAAAAEGSTNPPPPPPPPPPPGE